MNIYSEWYGTIPGASSDAAITGGVLLIVGILYAVILLFSLISYIFQSVGLHCVAKRRGIRHAWIAWIPVGSSWLLGCISDQYQHLVKHKIKRRRDILMWLEIAILILTFPVSAMSSILELLSTVFAPVLLIIMLLMILLAIVQIIVAIVQLVFYYIALYDVYRSCVPAEATLLLVVSILVPVLIPFFVFAYRKKDLGMTRKAYVSKVWEYEIPEEDEDAEAVCAQTAQIEGAEVAAEVVEEAPAEAEAAEETVEAEIVETEAAEAEEEPAQEETTEE